MPTLTHSSLALLAICAAPLITPLAASADPLEDITGVWTFNTGPYIQACQLSGRMIITPGERDGVYSCHLTTIEECPTVSGEVEQSCAIRVEGDQVAIVSEITRIVRQAPEAYGYAPDDWLLTMQGDGIMVGTLESAHRARAIFRRQETPVS